MTALTDEKYVSFTTFRRNGERVSTPVWIVDLGDGTVGFTTASESGKAKRLRVDSQVELAPSNAKGTVDGDAAIHIGTAHVVDGADFERVRAAIVDKYGIQFKLMRMLAKVVRREASNRGVIVTIDGTA